MGLNKWQDIVVEDMQKAEALASLKDSNWWSVALNFDEVILTAVYHAYHDANSKGFLKLQIADCQLLWRDSLTYDAIVQDVFMVNFVIIDSQSKAVDNNKGKDYEITLLDALSEEQIIERQAVALAEMEEKRLQVSPSWSSA